MEITKPSIDKPAHPFFIPVITFISLFIVTALLFITIGGHTIGADDARVVRLSIDGQNQVLPTRAKTVGELLTKLNIQISEHDIVEPAVDTVIAFDDFDIEIIKAKPVTLVDESGSKTTVLSAGRDPREIAQRAGAKVYAEDNVEVLQPENIFTERVIGSKISIDRAPLAHINLYGNQVEVRSHAKTVGELLEEKGLEPLDGDTITPAPDTPLTENTLVFIVRHGSQVATVEETIPAPLETIEDSNLPSGSTQVRQAGVDGKKVVTYEIATQNGVETGRTLLQEIVTVRAEKRVVAKGTRQLFADYNTDGIPSRVYCSIPRQRNWKNINVKNAAIGRALAAEKGWTGAEFNALLELWACESSWFENAGNPVTGAYGIPQAYPATKMASAGSDYRTNPRTQIIWGLDYIKRYGSPSGALSTLYRTNSY